MTRFIVQTFTTLLIFFILLFVYTRLAGPIPFSVNSINTNKTDGFSVSGEGKVSVVPDGAVVRVGIATNGISAEAAQKDLNRLVNKVSDAIKKLGIEGKDIKTGNYN